MAKKPRVIKPVVKSSRRWHFEQQRKDWSTHELYLELLYSQNLHLEKLENIRSNTSKLVWWLVVLPIVFGLLLYLLTKI